MEDKGNKKSSNAKVIWYILFAFVTVILCYLCTVVYFFYISPYNISLKAAIWPFLSEQNVGEMYLDATMEINFTVKDSLTYEDVEKTVVGVNVREDGYIIAPYSEFRSCSADTEIKIYANSGKVYSGKFLYGDMNYNLAVLKCENISSETGEIKIPFVSVSSASSSLDYETEVLAIASPLTSKTVWKGTVTDTSLMNVYKEMEIENNAAIDFVMEDCYTVELDVEGESFTGGAVFDKSGSILGLSYENTLEDGSYVIMPIDATKLFLTNVVVAYKKQQTFTDKLVESVVGLDQVELYCQMLVSDQNYGREEYFYFNNDWQIYTDEIIRFSNSDTTGYYLFEDWVYNGNTILSANNVVSYIGFNGETYAAETKTAFMEGLYKAKAGDYVTVYYYEINSLGTTLKSVGFTV